MLRTNIFRNTYLFENSGVILNVERDLEGQPEENDQNGEDMKHFPNDDQTAIGFKDPIQMKPFAQLVQT
jgi:hypothetical protein